jgi:hypothetical protein
MATEAQTRMIATWNRPIRLESMTACRPAPSGGAVLSRGFMRISNFSRPSDDGSGTAIQKKRRSGGRSAVVGAGYPRGGAKT